MYYKNILEEIRSTLIKDNELMKFVSDENIWISHVPEASRKDDVVIRLCLIDFVPSEYVANEQISYYTKVQIDCWSLNEDLNVFLLGQHIQRILKQLNFKQTYYFNAYEETTNHERDCRRFEANIYF